MNNQAPLSQANPRDLAAEILAEPNLARRQALLDSCPAELRAMVEDHVRVGFDKIRSYRKHMEQRAQLAQQKPPAASRREDCPNIVDHPRSAPEVGNRHLAALRAVVSNGART